MTPEGQTGGPAGESGEPELPPARGAGLEPEIARVERLGAYFRAHRGRFTREALNQAAIRAGYSAAEVEAAWAPISWESPGPPTARRRSGVMPAAAMTFVAGYYGLILLLTASPATSPASSVAATVGVVGGIIAWAALRKSNPALAQGIGCGVLIVIALPVILILTLFGLCLATGTLPINYP